MEEGEGILISGPEKGQEALTVHNGLVDVVNVSVRKGCIKLLASTVISYR
jgi:hypothetical protein